MEIIRSDAARAERESAPLLLNPLHHPHHPPPPPPLPCQARALDATLCPLPSDTSTMTSPSPAALPTPSTAAWAAPVRKILNIVLRVWNGLTYFLWCLTARCALCSGLCGLQPRTEVPHWRQGDPLWPDGHSVLLHSGQRKARAQRLENRKFPFGFCVRKDQRDV